MSHVHSVPVLIQRIDPDVPLPRYAQPGDAGMDLSCTEAVILAPGQRRLVPTGIAIALPAGYVGLVHPRSGLANKYGVSIVNAPGTIDAGYRGEIKVNLINMDPQTTVELPKGSRIAQLVVQEFVTATWHEVEELPGSDRGEHGFGSSGISNEVVN